MPTKAYLDEQPNPDPDPGPGPDPSINADTEKTAPKYARLTSRYHC